MAIVTINRRLKTMYEGFRLMFVPPRPFGSGNGDHALPRRRTRERWKEGVIGGWLHNWDPGTRMKKTDKWAGKFFIAAAGARDFSILLFYSHTPPHVLEVTRHLD
jgi:hypothetical protein